MYDAYNEGGLDGLKERIQIIELWEFDFFLNNIDIIEQNFLIMCIM